MALKSENTSNAFNFRAVPLSCALFNNDDKVILNLKKAVQLGLFVRLYKDFGCQGPFHYYKGRITDNEKLADIRSYAETAVHHSFGKILSGGEHVPRVRRDTNNVTSAKNVINTTGLADGGIKVPLQRSLNEIKKKIRLHELAFWTMYFEYLDVSRYKTYIYQLRVCEYKYWKIEWDFFVYPENMDSERKKKLYPPSELRIWVAQHFIDNLRHQNSTSEKILSVLSLINDNVRSIVKYHRARVAKNPECEYEYGKNRKNFVSFLWIDLQVYLFRVLIFLTKKFTDFEPKEWKFIPATIQ